VSQIDGQTELSYQYRAALHSGMNADARWKWVTWWVWTGTKKTV